MNRERERIRKEVFDKPKKVIQGYSDAPGVAMKSEVNPELLKLFPPERIKRIMTKELRRYKQALEKKWANWFEAVSK